jgi:hypothetical protein
MAAPAVQLLVSCVGTGASAAAASHGDNAAGRVGSAKRTVDRQPARRSTRGNRWARCRVRAPAGKRRGTDLCGLRARNHRQVPVPGKLLMRATAIPSLVAAMVIVAVCRTRIKVRPMLKELTRRLRDQGEAVEPITAFSNPCEPASRIECRSFKCRSPQEKIGHEGLRIIFPPLGPAPKTGWYS